MELPSREVLGVPAVLWRNLWEWARAETEILQPRGAVRVLRTEEMREPTEKILGLRLSPVGFFKEVNPNTSFGEEVETRAILNVSIIQQPLEESKIILSTMKSQNLSAQTKVLRRVAAAACQSLENGRVFRSCITKVIFDCVIKFILYKFIIFNIKLDFLNYGLINIYILFFSPIFSQCTIFGCLKLKSCGL